MLQQQINAQSFTMRCLNTQIWLIIILLQAVLWETPGLIRPPADKHIPNGSSDPSQPSISRWSTSKSPKVSKGLRCDPVHSRGQAHILKHTSTPQKMRHPEVSACLRRLIRHNVAFAYSFKAGRDFLRSHVWIPSVSSACLAPC